MSRVARSIKVAAILGLVAIAGCDYPGYTAARASQAAASAAAADAAASQAAQAFRSNCLSGRKTLVEKYNQLRAAHKNWEAARSLDDCAAALDDSDLRRLVASAEIPEYWRDAKNASNTMFARSHAIDKLASDFPSETKAAIEYRAKLYKERDRLEAAEKRSKGVSIGMSREDAIASSWGRPQSINRTTHATGTHEQWVYGGSNYLYFENGILTSIQH